MYFEEPTVHRARVVTPLGDLWGGILPTGELIALEYDTLDPPLIRAEEKHTAESRATAAERRW